MSALAVALTWLVENQDLILAIEKALENGLSKPAILKMIDAAMVEAGRDEIQKEFPGG